MDRVEALSLVVAFIFAITARITKSVLSHSSSSFLILLMVLSGVGSTSGQVSVLTQHNDNGRSGANLSETRLNTSNVNSRQFRKLYSLRVDGNIFAQPLYVPHVSISGRNYNVLFVATEHNTVYAFDADVSSVEPLWHRNLGTSAAMPNSDFGDAGGNFNLVPEVGITSTPVIDVASRILYVVAFTKESDGYHHKLHALDITNGAERLNGPVEISGSVNGNSCRIPFVPKQQLQRPALLLSGGFIYIAFGSHNDKSPYNGWVFAYHSNLQLAGIFNTTPSCVNNLPNPDSKGGIWQAGQGLVADAGYVYFLVGDGFFASSQSFGSSFVKLSSPANGSLPVADWFAPKNQAVLNGPADNDLGSAGPLLLPGTGWLLGGGKEGKLYLVDSTNMGRYDPEKDHVLQVFPATQPSPSPPATGHIHGSPIYWQGPANKEIYVWGENDNLRAYKLNNSGPNYFTPWQAANLSIVPGMPGGILSLSANANTSGTGIVWATHPFRDNASDANVEGVLHAFDASNLSTELWSSEFDRFDSLGLFAKFCPVTIANGKVYVPTFSGYLHVYGLRSDYRAPRQPPAQPTPTATFLGFDTATGGNWSGGGYGSAGYYVVGDSAVYPPGAKVNPIVPRARVWRNLAPTPAMLRKAPRTTGTTDTSIAASWTSDLQESFLIDIDLDPGITYRVSLYVVDWDNARRSEQIDILNAADETVLNGQTVTLFENGKYLKWNITGHVRIRIKKLTGNALDPDRAVVSGLFFDRVGP